MIIYEKINVNTDSPMPKPQGQMMYVFILKQVTVMQLNMKISFSKYFLSLLKNDPINVFFRQ